MNKEKMKFYATAMSVHAAFLFSMLLEHAGDSLSFQPWGSWITTGIGAFIFFACIITFYLRPDFFLISYRIYNTIRYRFDSNPLLSKGSFYFMKILVWLLVVALPIVFILIANHIPGAIKLYLMIGFSFFFMSNGNFIFRAYEDYCALKKECKWGILFVYSKHSKQE